MTKANETVTLDAPANETIPNPLGSQHGAVKDGKPVSSAGMADAIADVQAAEENGPDLMESFHRIVLRDLNAELNSRDLGGVYQRYLSMSKDGQQQWNRDRFEYLETRYLPSLGVATVLDKYRKTSKTESGVVVTEDAHGRDGFLHSTYGFLTELPDDDPRKREFDTFFKPVGKSNASAASKRLTYALATWKREQARIESENEEKGVQPHTGSGEPEPEKQVAETQKPIRGLKGFYLKIMAVAKKRTYKLADGTEINLGDELRKLIVESGAADSSRLSKWEKADS